MLVEKSFLVGIDPEFSKTYFKPKSRNRKFLVRAPDSITGDGSGLGHLIFFVSHQHIK